MSKVYDVDHFPSEEVTIRRNGKLVKAKIRSLTAGERSDIIQALVDDKGKPLPGKKLQAEMTFRSLAACLVDENNKPIFTESQLRSRNSSAIDALFDVCDQVNALSAEAIQDVAKN